jgi:hypothetical protein
MKKKFAFSRMIRWVKSTELFARPSREIPGVWHLFEYYAEPEGKLVHIKAGELAENHLFWEIAFDNKGRFRQKSNLPIQFFPGVDTCYWHVKVNFITLIHPEFSEKREKFQFALDHHVLKLLKKEPSGRIEIFGFFRKSAGIAD